MAINFPATPTLNQTYTFNGRTWTYNGVGWQATGASGLSVYTKTTFTATASQTTFSVTYTVGFMDVYLNGVKLTVTDFTATNGTTVVLAVAAALNDIVETVAWTVSTTLNPALGIASATSLALGGATIGTNALAVTGTAAISGVITGPTAAAGTNTTQLATTAFVQSALVLPNNYISNLLLSTAGSSATFGIAVGVAMDSTNVALMTLASAYTKTTSAWALGTAAGSLDTGTIANTTWYHVWLIQRSDTGVVDVLISTSATAPTMPASYDRKRRIGSMLTDGSAQWVSFTQNGDLFTWYTPLGDISVNQTTSQTARVVNVPTGVQVVAKLRFFYNVSATENITLLVSSIAEGGLTSSSSATGQLSGAARGQPAIASPSGNELAVLTNTSAQVNFVANGYSTAPVMRVGAFAWIDERGSNG
jgi:hypothetical protein